MRTPSYRIPPDPLLTTRELLVTALNHLQHLQDPVATAWSTEGACGTVLGRLLESGRYLLGVPRALEVPGLLVVLCRVRLRCLPSATFMV